MSISHGKSAVAGLVAAVIVGVGLVAVGPADAGVGRDTSATSKRVVKSTPPVSGAAATTALAAEVHLYAGVYQFAQTGGISARITVAQPALATGDFFSLGQLSAESSNQRNGVEAGWTVNPGVNKGSVTPHLFVFFRVDGVGKCWNFDCPGFELNPHSTPSVKPGDPLPANTRQTFRIRQNDGAWWIGFNNEWIGFYRNTLWEGGFTNTGLVQAFGEVAAQTSSPCTDMGNGLPGENRDAARISSITYVNGPNLDIDETETHPSLYSVGNVGTNSARFGGPGAC
jgi:hypothetical protein